MQNGAPDRTGVSVRDKAGERSTKKREIQTHFYVIVMWQITYLFIILSCIIMPVSSPIWTPMDKYSREVSVYETYFMEIV